MNCLIVAAGMGGRLRERGQSKPLIPVNGVRLLERVIARARSAGVERFFVVTGYRGEDVRAALDIFSAREAIPIVHIGKVIREFNAIDTGVFLCTPVIFDALEASQAAGDDSISGAMNVLAREDRARVFDIQGRLWLDVDDPATLDKAETLLNAGRL